jgi:hypothetical protein
VAASKSLRSIPPNEENHSFRFEGIPNANLQENPCRGVKFRQIQLQQFQRFLLSINRFEIFHGRLLNVIASEAKQSSLLATEKKGLLRRCAPRNDKIARAASPNPRPLPAA